MAIINESTITHFLSRLSVDATEQANYYSNVAHYLGQVTNMPQAKKDILLRGQAHEINAAARSEQAGPMAAAFTLNSNHNIYQASLLTSDQIIHLIRSEIQQHMNRK